jgi:hypothetical protein
VTYPRNERDAGQLTEGGASPSPAPRTRRRGRRLPDGCLWTEDSRDDLAYRGKVRVGGLEYRIEARRGTDGNGDRYLKLYLRPADGDEAGEHPGEAMP